MAPSLSLPEFHPSVAGGLAPAGQHGQGKTEIVRQWAVSEITMRLQHEEHTDPQSTIATSWVVASIRRRTHRRCTTDCRV